MVNGDRTSVGWTLILWDIENVPVPDQLRTPAGIKQVKTVLREKFAKSRELQLHCIKLACRWPDHRSPYADLLGWLTTLGDVEALGYQWQGQKDKSHNADKLLKQAADHFMHMLESHNGPDHLVVFITSDQDFGEKIQELQRRNFKVAVIYHGPHASKRPASIIHAADESYDWLEFLAKELKASKLTLSPYDSSVMQPGTSVAATPPATLVKAEAKKANQDVKAGKESAPAKEAFKKQPASCKVGKNTSESTQSSSSTSGSLKHCKLNDTEQVCSSNLTGQDLETAQKLLDAIARSLPSDAHEFTKVVAKACLLDGFCPCPRGYQLVPVSCCAVGAIVKQDCPHIQGKLIANLQQQKCQQFFRIVPGPAGTQPAVLPVLTAMIDKPYSKAVGKIMNKVYSSSAHPSSSSLLAGYETASQGSLDSDATDQLQVSADVLALHLHVAMSNTDQGFVRAVASICLQEGLMEVDSGYRLDAVPCAVIGAQLKQRCIGFTGKLLTNLQSDECQPYFRVIDGPFGTQPGVFANLSALIQKPHHSEIRRILKTIQLNAVHQSYDWID